MRLHCEFMVVGLQFNATVVNVGNVQEKIINFLNNIPSIVVVVVVVSNQNNENAHRPLWC